MGKSRIVFWAKMNHLLSSPPLHDAPYKFYSIKIWTAAKYLINVLFFESSSMVLHDYFINYPFFLVYVLTFWVCCRYNSDQWKHWKLLLYHINVHTKQISIFRNCYSEVADIIDSEGIHAFCWVCSSKSINLHRCQKNCPVLHNTVVAVWC